MRNKERPFAALYVRTDSVYQSLTPYCFDIKRDARGYNLGLPVVAHPPCRAWARLAHLAKPREGERELALHALDCVRTFGGVLEHPEGSKLWSEAGLLKPGYIDHFGGFTVVVDQSAFGHRARKRTWLYVCRGELPEIPPTKEPTTTVERMCAREREATPLAFAMFLAEIARSVA